MLYVSNLVKNNLTSRFPNNINMHTLSGLVNLFICIKFKMIRSSKCKRSNFGVNLIISKKQT